MRGVRVDARSIWQHGEELLRLRRQVDQRPVLGCRGSWAARLALLLLGHKLLWVRLESLLAAESAEVVRLTVVDGTSGSLRFIHRHFAYRIDCHRISLACGPLLLRRAALS